MKKLILSVLAFAISMNAHAAYDCNVKVINVLIYSEGSVNILHSGRGDYTVVCNLNVERSGVSPTTCAMWAGMLQAIKKKNGLANFYFNGDSTCAALPVYGSAPAPVYIGDVTP